MLHFLSFLRLTGQEPFYYRIIGFCVLGPSSLTIFSVKLGVESLFQPISWEGFSPMSFPFSPVPKGTVFLPAQHTSSLEELLSNVPVHRGRFHSQSCRPWPLCPMASSALNLPLDVALIYPPLFLDDGEWWPQSTCSLSSPRARLLHLKSEAEPPHPPLY